ncbi:unnamed protein product [Pseudo-nitzschia multistriata]|uniref:Major facilitator superfamily (MFS) profile domain-containing protein n=1 Tax=Pseudo-nitzschia multistriata TaxID=183589 RepID=A0A448YU72_9STRA|nr:unnamed protein product [Pseudo-nitzschia multistriata]
MDHALHDEPAVAAPASAESATTAPSTDPADGPPPQGDASKKAFCSRLGRFARDSIGSKAVLAAFAVTTLSSFSIALTVGIVPEVLTDRYARLYHGYGSSEAGGGGNPPAAPCWEFDKSFMPEACVRGADDAQTGAAWAAFLQNTFTFFFNAVVGSYTDVHGRRLVLVAAVFANALVPAALLAMQLLPAMDPAWYYCSNASTGILSYTALVFAALSDGCPEEYLAGRFATNMAGFYVGFAAAPTLAVWMGSHLRASGWSFALAAAALVCSVAFLPETLPEPVAVRNRGAVEEERPPAVPLPAESEAHGNTNTNGPLAADSSSGSTPRARAASCLEATGTVAAKPLRDMTILGRDAVMKLLALGSFLAAAVYSTDASLILFYIEEYFDVRENDIAFMFVVHGTMGVVLQGIGLQPLVYALGEHGLLVLCFLSGTLHNFLYGAAKSKTTLMVALSLSQLTKLGYPVLSSLASRRVGANEQGQVQGALLALNALGGAVGPVSMNWIYERTKEAGSGLGPGAMFLFASVLYLLGAVVVAAIPSAARRVERRDTSGEEGPGASGAAATTTDASGGTEPSPRDDGDLEEPLLLRLGVTSTI